VISCALPFNDRRPQNGFAGRHNPIHTMMADGGDVLCGAQDFIAGGFRCADDSVTMPLQCGTQWDALSHVMYDGKMYGDRDVSLVTSRQLDRQKSTMARCALTPQYSCGEVGSSEIFWLDALAGACAEDGNYAFLIVAAPLPITVPWARRLTRSRSSKPVPSRFPRPALGVLDRGSLWRSHPPTDLLDRPSTESPKHPRRLLQPTPR